jgi:PHD/YefM family antitoxin component YafN of YafNO toxin-antitoxin module
MPRSIRELQAQYITDAKGNKTAVILPLEEYEELLEDLQDLAALAERRDEPAISHEEVIARLKRDGYIQD